MSDNSQSPQQSHVTPHLQQGHVPTDPQPGHVPPPAYVSAPPGGYGLPPEGLNQPTGMLAWGVGLAMLCFLPFVSSLVAGLIMVFVGLDQRRRGGVAAINGRNAANWGLTYAIATLVLAGLHFGLLYALTRDGDTIKGFFPFGIFLVVWGLITLVHLIYSVVGMVAANGRRPFAARGAIPFFRR